MHEKDIRFAGTKLEEATKALIMLHGRGAPAEDILGLSGYLAVTNFALIAPQATNYTWYPYSFLAPATQNEPWLSSALAMLKDLVAEVNQAGISDENIYFCGFSQGACLTLEFVARNARKWGGVAAFTGGLIGDKIDASNYNGDFQGTRVFIGSSDPDPHIPVERVRESVRVLTGMKASVREKIYPNMGHTITEDELRTVNQWIFSPLTVK
jgi:phospholipase/carboxylesterase